MRKSFIALALLVVTSSAFLTSCAESVKQKTLDKILAQKTIVVGTTGQQFPFTFKGASGELEGIDIKIANYLAKELGVAVKYEVMDFENLIPAVQNGQVDIVFSGVSITTERNAKVVFPGVYFKSGKSILTKSKKLSKGDAEHVNISTVTLATTKGTTSEEFVKNRFPNAQLVLVENNAEAIALLGADEVHGIVADFETCESLAFGYEESFLYYNNISKSTEKEFISPVIAAHDNHFTNLIANYITRINAEDKSETIDEIWYEYAK
ncbi:transporter substrate-binding domain-containing protein [Flavicella sp.]|uniref:substrate-binding periplasmic protein n=1 Tax=Flavicella sp. TaxID=2957742 RepID=UPI002623874C|nr:transporter substrate-binding domain-containing protein [Flavicella sp.]MDG1805694.1 transporter substrate-binding domain-containing protein [Flavicella sp.]MDG2279473.1 transporter substrate-binding domain-containing protein [Flavicella sp.]